MTKAVDAAAGSGHLKIVKYIMDSKHGSCSALVLDKAAACNHSYVVRWITTTVLKDVLL